MRSPARPLLAVLAAAAVLPAAAPAAERRAEPLVDRAPAPGARVVDRIVGSGGVRARAAQSTGRAYAVSSGGSVTVTLAPEYAADDTVARSYVAFLDGLLHGEELGELSMRIVPPDRVGAECGGGGAEILACYVPARNLMIVPGEDRPDADVSASYVVAHEYGHHIANHRSNAPFSALDYGPKRWASEQDVCSETLAGRLAPGDERLAYLANPGEAWAETYAQLKYPEVGWSFIRSLQPDPDAFAAARSDVAQPWTGRRTRTFRGRLGASDTSDRFRFQLTLDGALTLRLRGPRRSEFDLSVSTSGRTRGRTRTSGSRDRLRFAAACVTDPASVTVTVRRRAGAGRFSVRAGYAG